MLKEINTKFNKKNEESNDKIKVLVKFKSSVKNSKIILIEVMHKSVSRSKIKEEIPKHSGRERYEAFLCTTAANKLIMKEIPYPE